MDSAMPEQQQVQKAIQTLPITKLGNGRWMDYPLKIYVDSGSAEAIAYWGSCPWITGVTTNPSLLKKGGVVCYREFAEYIVSVVPKEKHISLEVLTSDRKEMIEQARILASMGQNVQVKIPVVNRRGGSNRAIIQQLLYEGIPVNVTAVMSAKHVYAAYQAAVKFQLPAMTISIFAGRVGDMRRNPKSLFHFAHQLFGDHRPANVNFLWASTRSVADMIWACEAGADVITISPELLEKVVTQKTPQQYAVETVRQFEKDAKGLTW